MNPIQKPCPNFWKGRDGLKPEAIVLHSMDGTLAGTDSWFANPASQVSSHFGVGAYGELHQYVKEEDTAWTNGIVNNPSWSILKPNVNPNKYTLTIEHEGTADTLWSDEMKNASAKLVRYLADKWQIPLDRTHVIGHYQIDSVKKPNCPARNKAIIDEIIALAKGTPNNHAEAMRLLAEAQALVLRAVELLKT